MDKNKQHIPKIMHKICYVWCALEVSLKNMGKLLTWVTKNFSYNDKTKQNEPCPYFMF